MNERSEQRISAYLKLKMKINFNYDCSRDLRYFWSPFRIYCGNHSAGAYLLDTTRKLAADLNQFLLALLLVFRRRRRRGIDCLWGSPVVDIGDLVDTGDGAVRRTALGCQVLALDVVERVLRQRHARKAALLRAVVH